MTQAEPRFVGEGRRAIVDGIRATYEDVFRSGTPRWVDLRAPIGWGKTRVVHEFYRDLASRQPSPPYWPPAIVGASHSGVADNRYGVRKLTNPTVGHVPGSLPSYLWWGISASTRNGESSFALEADVLHLRQHASYVDDALRDRTSVWSRGLTTVRDRGMRVGAELASSVLETVLDVAVPFIGPLTELVGFTMEQVRLRQERESRLSGEDIITDERFLIVDEVLKAVLSITGRAFPVIISIEDAHYADPLLGELVERVMSAQGPILVLSTSWTAVQPSPLDAVRSRVFDRRIEITPEVTRIAGPFPASASLEALGQSERLKLVDDVMPHLAPEVQRIVASKYPNPLAVVLLSQIERLQPEGHNEVSSLTVEDVAGLPLLLSDLYRDSWMTLPASVRKSLHVASLITPRGIRPTVDVATSWGRDHLNVLSLASGSSFDALPPPEEVSGWIRSVGQGSEAFVDPNQFDIALGDQDILRTTQRAAILGHLAETLTSAVAERRPMSFGHLQYSVQIAAALHDADLVEDSVYVHFLMRYIARASKMPGACDRVLNILDTWAGLGYPGGDELRRQLPWEGVSASLSGGHHGRAEEWMLKWLEWNPPSETSSYEPAALRIIRAELFPALTHQDLGTKGESVEDVAAWAANFFGPEHPLAAAAAAARGNDSDRPREGGSQEGVSRAWSVLQRARMDKSSPVTMEKLAPYPTFNTITDHPELGDLRRFVSIRRAGQEGYERSVDLEPGATYEVRVIVVNAAAYILNTRGRHVAGMARFTRVRAIVPTLVRKGQTGRIGAEISAENSFPRSVADSIDVRCRIDVALRFVPASCTVVSGGKVNGKRLADLGVTESGQEFGIFSSAGAMLGYSDLNGILPGGPAFACVVTYELKVDYPNSGIEVVVSVPERRMVEAANAPQDGTIFMISIRYRNTGTTDQRNVTLSSELPDGVELVPGTIVVTNNSNPKGLTLTADRLRRFNVGHYGPGAFADLGFLVHQEVDAGARTRAGAAPAFVTAKAETRNGVRTVSAPLEAPNRP